MHVHRFIRRATPRISGPLILTHIQFVFYRGGRSFTVHFQFKFTADGAGPYSQLQVIRVLDRFRVYTGHYVPKAQSGTIRGTAP